MKKLFKFCLALLLSVTSLTPLLAQAEEGGLDVVATTTHVTDLVKVLSGDHVNVSNLMGPGIDPHGYAPTPSDISAIEEGEVVAYNGLHLEAMFSDVFEGLEGQKPLLVASDALSEDQLLGSDEEDLEYDPHIWFSIPLWKQVAEYYAAELSAIDEANAAVYQENLENYLVELDELDAYVRERIQEIPEESRYLVTAHDAFNYLGDEYGLEVVGIQGLNTQTEAGTGDIAEVAQFIVDQNIKAVFVESSVSSRNVEALVEAVEAQGGSLEIGGELYSDSLGTEEEDAETYIKMFKKNIDTIVDALK